MCLSVIEAFIYVGEQLLVHFFYPKVETINSVVSVIST